MHAAYKSRESFDAHHTTRHSEQSAFPDQLKAGWFCLTKQFFSIKGRKDVDAIHLGKKGQFEGKISSSAVGAYEKGVDKIKKDFKAKLYNCFPDIRYNILVDDEVDDEADELQ